MSKVNKGVSNIKHQSRAKYAGGHPWKYNNEFRAENKHNVADDVKIKREIKKTGLNLKG